MPIEKKDSGLILKQKNLSCSAMDVQTGDAVRRWLTSEGSLSLRGLYLNKGFLCKGLFTGNKLLDLHFGKQED